MRGILEGALVLSTGNRSEVYGVSPQDAPESNRALSEFLSSDRRSILPSAISSPVSATLRTFARGNPRTWKALACK